MIRPVVKVGNPVLREKARPVHSVDRKILNLIDDLTETLLAQTDPEGIGLAAPQIGVSQRVFVARISGHVLPFVNPEFVSQNKDVAETIEGCLSISSYYGTVRRATEVTIRALNKRGKLFTRTYKNLNARIMQHEMDHLNGSLYVDRVAEQKGTFYELVGDTLQEVTL